MKVLVLEKLVGVLIVLVFPPPIFTGHFWHICTTYGRSLSQRTLVLAKNDYL